jgi:hypothetical protein
MFSFLWFFDFLKYRANDFEFIYSLAILVQSLLLFIIIYLFSGNKKLFYFLFFYLMVFLSFFYNAFNFLYLFLITSFLLTLLFFIGLLYKSDFYKKISYLGIIYSFVSLFLFFLLLFNIGEAYTFSLFSNFLFFILTIQILEILSKNPPLHKNYSSYGRTDSYFVTFFRYFIFILILTNFVFIATIAIHEFGHFTVAGFYDCEYKRIVYEKNFPHTEVLCRELTNRNWVTLGGLLSPFLISLFLLIVGGKFIKDISLLIIGFNLIASNKDLLDLGFSENLVMASIIAGILFLIFGIVMLARSRTEEYGFIGI